MINVAFDTRQRPMPDRDLEFHRQAMRSGLVDVEIRPVQDTRCIVTWNEARDAFAVESLLRAEAHAVAAEIDKRDRTTSWFSESSRTERGTLVSQFLIIERRVG